ncbi:MAG: DUF480 domain-containing protein [Actinobacteria bacterium]|nr:DUF480 domain-containing protein [Actinomycetota bacterium]
MTEMHAGPEEVETDLLAETALLNETEARVLGCLLEKERTTPADYPLTTNALTRACSQTTSRNPVLAYQESAVESALVAMKDRGLVRFVHSQSNRSTKYRQVVDEVWNLAPDQVAVLCVLLLRGPQTPGEIKTRTERLFSFDSLDAVERALTSLASRHDAMVLKLDRSPGQKDQRWVQLLTGAPSAQTISQAGSSDSQPSRLQAHNAALEERISAVELELERMRKLLEDLIGPIGD